MHLSTFGQYVDGITWRPLWARKLFLPREESIDFDGNDFLDHLTMWRTDNGPPYDLVAISGLPRGATEIGQPCATTGHVAPVIGIDREPFIGEDLVVNLSNVRPGATVFLLVGDRMNPFPGHSSGPFFSLPCRPLVRPKHTFTLTTEELIPRKGSATARISVPDDPSALGLTFHVQWLVPGTSNGASFAASRALRIRVSDRLSRDSCP